MRKVKLKTLTMLLFFVGIVLISYNNVYASDASSTLTEEEALKDADVVFIFLFITWEVRIGQFKYKLEKRICNKFCS